MRKLLVVIEKIAAGTKRVSRKADGVLNSTVSLMADRHYRTCVARRHGDCDLCDDLAYTRFGNEPGYSDGFRWALHLVGQYGLEVLEVARDSDGLTAEWEVALKLEERASLAAALKARDES